MISAFLAFMLWGGWAFLVNGAGGITIRLISGFTQGTASFIITLIMVRSITWLFHHLPDNLSRLVLPAVITVGCTGSCLAGVHYLVDTPRIVQTISPALTVAFIFCFYTTMKLEKASGKKD